jgi:hypothetical protein
LAYREQKSYELFVLPLALPVMADVVFLDDAMKILAVEDGTQRAVR